MFYDRFQFIDYNFFLFNQSDYTPDTQVPFWFFLIVIFLFTGVLCLVYRESFRETCLDNRAKIFLHLPSFLAFILSIFIFQNHHEMDDGTLSTVVLGILAVPAFEEFNKYIKKILGSYSRKTDLNRLSEEMDVMDSRYDDPLFIEVYWGIYLSEIMREGNQKIFNDIPPRDVFKALQLNKSFRKFIGDILQGERVRSGKNVIFKIPIDFFWSNLQLVKYFKSLSIVILSFVMFAVLLLLYSPDTQYLVRALVGYIYVFVLAQIILLGFLPIIWKKAKDVIFQILFSRVDLEINLPPAIRTIYNFGVAEQVKKINEKKHINH